ncbi:putative RNA-directed DNA polymerase, eukaryota, reverse transcriptase zinc-binding domain protein [Tanacetum coccineum]
MDELKEAVWGCGSEKAPGPNGYTFAFVKKYWDMLKVDILGFVNSFLSLRKIPLALILRSLLSSLSLIWRSWIKACLESSRTSILVNGSPTFEFNVRRGLRQGDPLSPFLFIIIMEGLHMALSDSVRNGFIRGINTSSSGINISHLFFADDVIITTDWSTHDLENVIRIFKVFYLASSLKINIYNSSIYGVRVSYEEVQLMASNTGCNAGLFPFSYLGLPIGSNMSLTANWKFLVDKFHSKHSSWNANLLSYGGLLTLLKAVLGSLGIYFLSLFKAPTTVKVIRALLGSEDGFDQNGCKFNGIWSSIVRTSNYLYSSSIIPMDSIRYQVGCGSIIRFWKDTWLGSSPFCMRFSRLFRLERKKDCLIRDQISNGQWKWNFSRSILGARNSTHLNHMLADISQIEVREGPDKCIWSTAHDGMFSVVALRCLIDDHMLPSLVTKTTWDKTLPRKVNIFMWRLKLDRLPYRLNLSSRGIEIPEISYPFCNSVVESNVHIFFECSFAKEVWKTIRRWCGDSFPLFDSNTYWIEWLASWYGSQVKKKHLLVFIRLKQHRKAQYGNNDKKHGERKQVCSHNLVLGVERNRFHGVHDENVFGYEVELQELKGIEKLRFFS